MQPVQANLSPGLYYQFDRLFFRQRVNGDLVIISASRRTDIPAFYGEWFVNRLRAGEVLVRNPMNYRQVSRISLAPESVDAIVFWTKNPANLIPFLPEIAGLGYACYFLFTLNPYDRELEPCVPDKESIFESFRELSRRLGPERVVWRYDPVIITDRCTPAWHAGEFLRLAERLSGYTEQCIISFLDEYRKQQRRMAQIPYILPDKQQMGDLAGMFADAARVRGISIATCSHDIDLSLQGIAHSRCIDGDLVERISGRKLQRVKKDSRQRHQCSCIESRDIGSYNSCAHGCRYCYAVASHPVASAAMRASDPLSPLLCDTLRGDERIT